jgi:hypothetical protein
MYLLALPCITCAETQGCKDEQQSQLSQAHEHEEPDTDDCGNLCNCSCCGHIVSVNFQLTEFVINKPVFKNNNLITYCNIFLPSNYFGNIWQPPKNC